MIHIIPMQLVQHILIQLTEISGCCKIFFVCIIGNKFRNGISIGIIAKNCMQMLCFQYDFFFIHSLTSVILIKA